MTGGIKQILIDGFDFTDNLTGTDFVITYELDEKTGAIALGTTNEIELDGPGYEYIRDRFFTNPFTDYTKTSNVRIIANCCGERTYNFMLDAEGIVYCPGNNHGGCSAKLTLRTSDEYDLCYRQLGEKIFWKDNGFNGMINNPAYFAKLNFIQSLDIYNWVVLYLWIFVKSIPIISLIQIIDNLFGNGNNIFNRVEDWITGAGGFQVAFNARNAVEWNVKRCNLGFVAPALQNEPHSRLFILSAQYDNGIDIRFRNTLSRVRDLWEANAPNQTTLQLLDTLKPVFNAEYRLIGNTLYFDSKENIRAGLPTLLNLDDAISDSGQSYCIQYQQLNAWAYGRFEYKSDPSETEGNRALSIYNDIVEWNTNPVNEFQRDEYTNSIDFAATRFQNDELTTRYDIEEIAFFIESARRSSIWGRPHENEVLLSNGYAFLPKLITVANDEKAERVFLRTAPGPTGAISLFSYNRYLRFLENGLPTNLYNAYHQNTNPRKRIIDYYEIQGVSLPVTCEWLDLIDQHRVNLAIDTQYGKGYFDKVEVNFSTGEIKFDSIKI